MMIREKRKMYRRENERSTRTPGAFPEKIFPREKAEGLLVRFLELILVYFGGHGNSLGTRQSKTREIPGTAGKM